jgi:hypothetical protein
VPPRCPELRSFYAATLEKKKRQRLRIEQKFDPRNERKKEAAERKKTGLYISI